MQGKSLTPRPQFGLTLVETCCTLSIVALVAGTTIPSFDHMQTIRRVEGAAAEVAIDLHWIRTEAVARREGVRLSLYDGGSGTCAIVHTGHVAECSCATDGAAVCAGSSTLLKNTYFPAAGRVRIAANVASMRFDAINGTTTPAGTVRLSDVGGTLALNQVVNILGRVRTCAPAAAMPGVKAC